MKREDQVAERDAALLEAASRIHHRGEVKIVCGALVEAGEPTGTLNLQVRLNEIDALAAQIRREREGR